MDVQEIINIFQPIIIQIATPHGTGTGFYVKNENLIITNDHVVKGNSEAVISGKTLPKQMSPVLFNDSKYDLAFIRFPALSNAGHSLALGKQVHDSKQLLPKYRLITPTEGIVSKQLQRELIIFR
jgi:serine protease Do